MNNSKSTLKALLIGIDKYSISPLNGCINDLNAFHHFLKNQHDTNKTHLDVETLCNEEATRENVIATFLRYFSSLKDNDQALVYFSGHGSQMNAPRELWHNNPNKKLETIVLYDSRLGGGWDLARQEIAYLIWKVTHKKDVLFTTIIDCCHSGRITRIRETNIRRVKNSQEDRLWKDFLGAENYFLKNGKSVISTRKQILLAACRNNEVAKEKFIGSDFRGVFTFSLIKALQNSGGRLTYLELIRLTQLEVYNQTDAQHPQYHSKDMSNGNLFFLGNLLKEKPFSHLLFYNNQIQDGLPIGWLIDVGLIHGIEQEAGVKLMVVENNSSNSDWRNPDNVITEIELDKVLTDYSTIKQTNDLSLDSNYQAIFKKLPISKLKVAFHPDNDPSGLFFLEQEWKSSPSPFLQLMNNWQAAQFLIYANDDRYSIRRLGEELNVFGDLVGFKTTTVNQVFKNLETISKWFRIKNIKSSRKVLEIEKVELEFYKVIETTSNLLESIHEERIMNFLNKEPILNYALPSLDRPKKLIDPMFRLKIKNPFSMGRQLWFSVLYLGTNFSIKNELMPIQLLDPGEEKWLEYFDREQERVTTLIPLHIDDVNIENEIFEITEHFKILISNYEFDTHSMNQEGISVEIIEESNHRDNGQKTKVFFIPQSEWGSMDFSVKVRYPKL